MAEYFTMHRVEGTQSEKLPLSLRNHLSFTLLSALGLLVFYSLLRVSLLLYNYDLINPTPLLTFAESFLNGFRFDLRLTVYISIPLLLSILSPHAMNARRFHLCWLTAWSSGTLFLGILELDFYREFHQRLNSLVFQYMMEDSRTVLSMVWYGFPVVRYLLVWMLISYFLWRYFRYLDDITRQTYLTKAHCIQSKSRHHTPSFIRLGVFFLCFATAVVAARGTLKSGPPLRWGSAFTTDSLFANQLGLNGTLTFVSAAKERWFGNGNKIRPATLPKDEAQYLVRSMLLTPEDELIDKDSAAVRRILTPKTGTGLPIDNIVVILMESFAGHYVGALGGKGEITPYFDKLSREGLLFTRFFSNGTHTHQGMFATMACFPNLPGFEYLMQQPEGTYHFSGLAQLLSSKNYDDLYVYNGSFSWDNQSGFFGAQGMRNFIGRDAFINPVVSDPTWGVSDQDMFDRAAWELITNYGDKSFYALLQTLSNHTPYALPKELPVKPVTEFGHLNQHLTAMRYSDWALGQFFERTKKAPYFDNTMFVIVGDHGFSNPVQLTDMDLYRYYVPLLIIAPGIQEKFGKHIDTVGTQIDIVPTIMARLRQPVQHQCWGRDLLSLSPSDQGFGVIKPSGNDQTVALIEGDEILIQPPNRASTHLKYVLNRGIPAAQLNDLEKKIELEKKLNSFVEVSTQSLLENNAGAGEPADRLGLAPVQTNIPASATGSN